MKVLVFGAHPDDSEIACGGTSLLWAARGDQVVWVSTTNGDTGHHEIGGIELARRRYAEAQRAAAVGGIAEYRVLDQHSGELEPSVTNRKQIIGIIREQAPDVILTHRPNDYHPDHRATAQLVADASYIVSVPNMLALTDINPGLPRIFYLYDRFQRPYPFQADIVVDIDEVIERKLAMMACHQSQMYEWLPFNRGVLDQVPAGEEDRLQWLREQRLPGFAEIAERHRERLIEVYGEERGRKVRYAEAFEGCEYGAGYDAQTAGGLFPLPATPRSNS